MSAQPDSSSIEYQGGRPRQISSSHQKHHNGDQNVVHLLNLSIDQIEVRTINLTWDWRNRIITYLQDDILPIDKNKSKKLRMQAASTTPFITTYTKGHMTLPWRNAWAQIRSGASLKKCTKATVELTPAIELWSGASYEQDTIGPP